MLVGATPYRVSQDRQLQTRRGVVGRGRRRAGCVESAAVRKLVPVSGGTSKLGSQRQPWFVAEEDRLLRAVQGCGCAIQPIAGRHKLRIRSGIEPLVVA